MAQLPMPTFFPNGGNVSQTDGVAVLCSEPGTTIYYTVDGTTPSTSAGGSTKQYDVVALATLSATNGYETSLSCVVKAIATKSGFDASPVATSQSFYHYCSDPWLGLKAAIDNLNNGDQTYTMYYSFILPGTPIEQDGSMKTAVSIGSILGITESQFKQGVIYSLGQWSAMFASAFRRPAYNGNLTLNFQPAPNSVDGMEVGTSLPSKMSVVYPIPNPTGAGDLRFATLALGASLGGYSNVVGPVEGQIASINGDVVMNSEMSMTPDANMPSTVTDTNNFEFIMMHELGHALGCLIDDQNGTLHDDNGNPVKLMSYSATWDSQFNGNGGSRFKLSQIFPNGFVNDALAEKGGIIRRYSGIVHHANLPYLREPLKAPVISSIQGTSVANGAIVSISLPKIW